MNRSEKPKKAPSRDDLMIKRNAVRSPSSSLKKIRAALVGKGTDVYITIDSWRLKFNFGLKLYKPARKPRLTPPTISKHQAFAKRQCSMDILRLVENYVFR